MCVCVCISVCVCVCVCVRVLKREREGGGGSTSERERKRAYKQADKHVDRQMGRPAETGSTLLVSTNSSHESTLGSARPFP